MLASQQEKCFTRLNTILTHGGNGNVTDVNLETLLMYTCSKAKTIDVILFILKYHPNTQLKDCNGKTAVQYLEANEVLSQEEKNEVKKILTV